jgi:hypothetical protein
MAQARWNKFHQKHVINLAVLTPVLGLTLTPVLGLVLAPKVQG